MELDKIYNESAVDTMRRWGDGSIDMVVTSPPYGDIREYEDGVGKAWNFAVFVGIAKELYRVMKRGGVIAWNVGDQTIDSDESGDSFRQALYFKKLGFKLVDTMVYQKYGYRVSLKYGYGQNFEYVFILSKDSMPKTFNRIKDVVNQSKGLSAGGERKRVVRDYSGRGNVWQVKFGNIYSSHPAVMPESLARDLIISWSDKGDVIYDPFAGSGTTLGEAYKLGRRYVGSDLVKKYCDIAEERVRDLAESSLIQSF